MRGMILMVLCALALAGCEESTMVGSGCPNGACPEALVRDDDVCVVTTTVAEIAHTGDPDAEPFELCLPSPLERSEDGTIHGNLYFVIIGDMPGSEIECTDRAFLKPVTAEVNAAFGYTDPPGTKVCEVLQLPVVTTEDGGAPIVGAGDGFYYDDFSSACADSGGRILFTRNAHPWEGVIVKLGIAEVRDGQGEADETLTCEPLPGTAPVGAPCSLPQTEYFDSQAVIATNVDACGQGVCIAYHLEGRTDVECTETTGPDGSVSPADCASAAEIEQRMYCTCRCSGPAGATDLCDCPDSFLCVDVVDPIAPSVAGGYCVRNTTAND